MDRAASVFESPGEPASGSEREKELLEKIGELTVDRDFLARGSRDPAEAAPSRSTGAASCVNRCVSKAPSVSSSFASQAACRASWWETRC